jgi:hypothetical protein
MKKIVFFVCFFVSAFFAFGQQALWSTVKGSDVKYVALGGVPKEVSDLYDQYDYYYDFSGFDKDTFTETFDDGTGSWEWVYTINTMTVVAVKVYIEGGSVVYVVCVGKNGVDMIAFSNVVDEGNIETAQSRKARFEKWFKTLLN